VKLRKQLFTFFLMVLVGVAPFMIWGGSNMTAGQEDWLRVIGLYGEDPEGNMVLIQVDADGQLTIPLKGINPDEDLATVKLDANDQLYVMMKGLGDNIVAVDDEGHLSAIMKGEITGGELTHVRVDGGGQIIMVPRGQSGYYLAVDTQGHLSAIMKGEITGGELTHVRVDAGGQIIMVPRGQSGNYMAVDSSGFITAVLKGKYLEGLETIGLDSEGRISGYLVDDLDLWGQILRVGNAEQAARLGSPVSWDRRGQVQAVFDFSKGFHGVRQVPGAGDGAIELSPTVWQYGGYSVKLIGDKTTPFYSYIGAYMAVPPTDVWGCAINWSAEPTPAYLEMRLEGVIENTFYQGRIRYDFANTKLQYRKTPPDWVDIGTKDLEIANYIFHRMKVVIDLDNEVFVRVLLNNTQYDMSAALTTSSAPTVGDYARCEVYVYSDDGENDVVYLDTLIFTVKEPT